MLVPSIILNAALALEPGTRITKSGSYDAALCIIGEYVNITGPNEDMSENDGMGMQL